MNSALALLLLIPIATCSTPRPDPSVKPGTHSVMLTWTLKPQPVGTTIVSQRLYRNESGCGQSYATMVQFSSGVTATTDSLTKSHHKYSYWMTVVDQLGKESAISNCVTSAVIP